MLALVLALVCGTASGWGSSPSDCQVEDLSSPQNIVTAKLYRALCGGSGMPVLVSSMPATAGVEACFFVADTSTCASYWITAVNAAGMESCLGQGLSFPRVVGVGYPAGAGPEKWERFYDLAGRRLPHPPETPGVYWLKAPGGRARLVVIR